MVSTEEILITMLGKDEVTPVVNNIQGNVNSVFNGMSQSASASASSIGQAYQSVFDQIGRGLASLNQGMMGISSVNSMIMNELGATKSASEYVFGTTAVADTNQVLMKSWADAKTSYEDLYHTVDTVTDSSLTSMQELVPAMNAFKASTGATGQQLKDDVAENMAQFGAYVLALTGSQQLAKTAMTDLSKGLVGKGAFSALDQYGVTKETLMARGWSGKNEDIKGYMNAVRQVSGQVEELMNTSQGVDALMGKMWSRAGKRIGKEALPFVVDLKNAFMNLDKEMDGNLSTSILRVSLYIEEAQRKLYMFNTLWQGVKNISEAFSTLKMILGFTKVEQEANNLMQEENNRLVKESNRALMANNDLRLANAEAMGLQNIQSGGYPVGEYGVPMGAEGESGSWGSDVLANTAGGVLESKYDKLRNGGEDTVNVSDILKGNEQKKKDIQKIIRSEEDLSKTIESNLLNIPMMDTSRLNTNEYGHVLSNLVNDTNLRAGELEQIDNALDGNVDEMFTHAKLIGRHNDAIDEAMSEINKINNGSPMAKGLAEQDGTLDALWDTVFHHKEQKKVLQQLAEESKSGEYLTNLGELLGIDISKQMDLESLDKEYEKNQTFTRAIGDKIRGSFTSMSNAFEKIKSSPQAFLDKVTGTGQSIRSRVVNSFSNFGKSIDEIESGTSKGFLDRLNYALYNPFRGGKEIVEAGAVELEGMTGAVESTAVSMGEMATTEGIVATEAGVIATESEVAGAGMAEADAGITFMGLAEMGLVGAFTTLIVPTLAVAGVIAILIPIVAGLVAEALFFVNLVGQFMASLNWDFNIDGVAEKFQELGTALAWLGVAMASLTFTGIMSGLAYLATGFGNVKGMLGQAIGMLREVVGILNQFQYETQIDPNIATNLKNLGDALNGVSMALGSLIGVQVMSNLGNFVTLGGRLGTLTDTFRKAQRDLQEAIDTINRMDFTGIDESKVTTIKTTLDAISAFADAFKGLNDIRTTDAVGGFTSWILSGGLLGGSGKSITQAFESAKADIEEASQALALFDGANIRTPNEDTVNKLKLVGEAITGVSDAINGLRTLRDNYNWDDWIGGIFKGSDIHTVFGQAKTDLESISKELASMNLTAVPEGLSAKLDAVNKGVSGVATGVENIKSIPVVSRADVGNRIRQAVGSVQLAINGLSRFNGQTVDANIPTLLITVNRGVRGVAGSLQSALNIPMVDRAVIGARIRNAIDSVQLIINGLGRLKGQSISADISATLAQIRTSITNLKNVLNATNFAPQGRHMGSSLKNGVTLGMNGLNAKIRTQLTNAVNHSGAHALGRRMGTSLTNGFKAGLNLLGAVREKLSEIDLGAEISNFVTGGTNDTGGGTTHPSGSLHMETNALRRYNELNNNPKSTVGRVNTLGTINQGSTLGTSQKNVSINIGEGAIQLDARNMTAKESRQIMINALEGLNVVNNVDVNGA